MEEYANSILAIMGIIIGASLQYFFGKNNNKSMQQDALKNEAYVDYLRSFAQSAHGDAKSRKEALQAAADAKARIAIYGSSEVVSALAKFEKSGARLNNEKSVEDFLHMIKAMRIHKIKSSEDLLMILVGINKA